LTHTCQLGAQNSSCSAIKRDASFLLQCPMALLVQQKAIGWQVPLLQEEIQFPPATWGE